MVLFSFGSFDSWWIYCLLYFQTDFCGYQNLRGPRMTSLTHLVPQIFTQGYNWGQTLACIHTSGQSLLGFNIQGCLGFWSLGQSAKIVVCYHLSIQWTPVFKFGIKFPVLELSSSLMNFIYLYFFIDWLYSLLYGFSYFPGTSIYIQTLEHL